MHQFLPVMIITGNRILADQDLEPCAKTIWVNGSGKIERVTDGRISQHDLDGNETEFFDAKDLLVMPGIVDVHVSFNFK